MKIKPCGKQPLDFVTWCIRNGKSDLVKETIRKREAKKRYFSQPIRDKRLPENHVNDKRRYYREEYLRSEHWQKLKASKLQKNPCCEKCKSTKKLDVHHLDYKNLYDVLLSDLQTLCRKCHKMEHPQQKRNKRLKRRLFWGNKPLSRVARPLIIQ